MTKNKKEGGTSAFFWFRRDLRLTDNVGLYHALRNHDSVIPVFIFDTTILSALEHADDARVSFIYDSVLTLREELREHGGDILILSGDPQEIWEQLFTEYQVDALYYNRDYEPYAVERDQEIGRIAESHEIEVCSYKDQVIYEPWEILKDNGEPYSVYTPYATKWLTYFKDLSLDTHRNNYQSLSKVATKEILTLESLGFERNTAIEIPAQYINTNIIEHYSKTRNNPSDRYGTTHLGIHLRFGTISIRKLVQIAEEIQDQTYLKELVWREFFMQLLYHNPHTAQKSFKEKYENIPWRTDKEAEQDFARWSEGTTGYPMVDAGMRELNTTGYMHNRVRMICASFLCKQLLIDWRWGERYFASRLLDYEMASNVGNWQWAAGSGADAAPYFRIFNPYTQREKFDPDWEYVKRWVEEYDTEAYPEEIVDYKESRVRALRVYKNALE